MSTSPDRVGGALQLIRWCTFPLDPMELFRILEDTRVDELFHVMKSVEGAAARLAWAAYGERRGFIQATIGITQGVGEVHVDFTAPGFAIHDIPKYQ